MKHITVSHCLSALTLVINFDLCNVDCSNLVCVFLEWSTCGWDDIRVRHLGTSALTLGCPAWAQVVHKGVLLIQIIGKFWIELKPLLMFDDGHIMSFIAFFALSVYSLILSSTLTSRVWIWQILALCFCSDPFEFYD